MSFIWLKLHSVCWDYWDYYEQMPNSLCDVWAVSVTDLASASEVRVQVRKAFDMDFETITKLAEQEEAGSSGANFLPFLTGEPGCLPAASSQLCVVEASTPAWSIAV